MEISNPCNLHHGEHCLFLLDSDELPSPDPQFLPCCKQGTNKEQGNRECFQGDLFSGNEEKLPTGLSFLPFKAHPFP